MQVSGIPADIRTDFLSLWGIGSLFGKTIEVDMDYTHKNKVLRIKIGCLDQTLIPPSSDVFIKRGFFTLNYEVEAEMIPQDANMKDANNNSNGDDEGNDGNNKEMQNSDGKEMDMDPKDVPKDDARQGGGKNLSAASSSQGHPMMDICFGAFMSHIPTSGVSDSSCSWVFGKEGTMVSV
jgi:hypothetical protein